MRILTSFLVFFISNLRLLWVAALGWILLLVLCSMCSSISVLVEAVSLPLSTFAVSRSIAVAWTIAGLVAEPVAVVALHGSGSLATHLGALGGTVLIRSANVTSVGFSTASLVALAAALAVLALRHPIDIPKGRGRLWVVNTSRVHRGRVVGASGSCFSCVSTNLVEDVVAEAVEVTLQTVLAQDTLSKILGKHPEQRNG